MSLDLEDDGTLPNESARRLLMRAAELDGPGDARLSISQLRQIAIEAGISHQSFETALQELPLYPAPVDRDLSRHRSSESRPPAWVRFCLFGVPDRRIATGYYWLFLAGLVGFPLRYLLSANPGSEAGLTSMLGGVAFCTFAIWSSSRAIRWLDRHSWDML
jgi:hypothetical protein